MGVWQKLTKEQRKKVPRERLYITAVVDYASKSLVALRVHREAPSIMTVLATLEMVCIDKSDVAARYGCASPWNHCGSVETVAADSATWFTKLACRVTINDLGAKLFLPPAGGKVELPDLPIQPLPSPAARASEVSLISSRGTTAPNANLSDHYP
jgi:putative transposase